jgi:hypothetical protein
MARPEGLTALALSLVLSACAASPGYRTGTDIPPLRVDIAEFVEDRLAALGYDLTSVVPRAMSVTFSAVKITTGDEAGALILDWLHVTVSPNRFVTGAEGSWGNHVEVRAESFAEERERRAIPTTPQAIADANAFVASPKAQPAKVEPGGEGG